MASKQPEVQAYLKRYEELNTDERLAKAIAMESEALEYAKSNNKPAHMYYRGMASYFWKRAIRAFYTEKDIGQFALDMHHAAVCEVKSSAKAPHNYVNGHDLSFLTVITRGSSDLNLWMSQALAVGFEYMQNVPRKPDYPDCMCLGSFSSRGLQLKLILQKDWKRVEERAKLVLSNPHCVKKKELLLWEFDLALVNGDVAEMSRIVTKMASPAGHRYFEQLDSVTYRVISLAGYAYTRLARFFGFDLVIETPWVPKELIEVDLFDSSKMLDQFSGKDIWNSYEVHFNDSAFTKDYSQLAPRADKENKVTFDECWKFFQGDAKQKYYFNKP